MAIELPGKLVWVMNLLGFRWPEVDEDRVREFAGRVREFASGLDGSHQAATATVRGMAEHYEADSYRVLASRWRGMTVEHVDELVGVCGVVATTIEVAADAVVAAKVAVIAQLTFAAVEFAAATAATAATFGAAAAAEAALVEATRRVVDGILRELEERIVAELLTQAVEPLERVVEGVLTGLVFPGARGAAAPAADGDGEAVGGFRVVPGELVRHAELLQEHADQVTSRAREFESTAAGVSFR
ncbi:WXG100-like domain-containing protein [Kitasatospora sp. NPDC001664]